MIFVFIMDWLRVWFKEVVFSVCTTPYFYALGLLWFIAMLTTNYFFFYMIDRFRFQYMYKNIAYELFKIMLTGWLVATLLVALYDAVAFYTLNSDFVKNKQVFLEYGIFGVSGGCCFLPLIGQPWYVVQHIMTVLFLASVTLLAQMLMSNTVYHLQDTTKSWLYFGLLNIVMFICYGFFWMLGIY